MWKSPRIPSRAGDPASTGDVDEIPVLHSPPPGLPFLHRSFFHRWKNPVDSVENSAPQKRSFTLALMSRMTSFSSVLLRRLFSILSTECMTVVWCWP